MGWFAACWSWRKNRKKKSSYLKFYSDANAGQSLRELFPIFLGANPFVLILYELERVGGHIWLFACYALIQLSQKCLWSEQSELFGDIFILAGLLFWLSVE